MTTVITLDSVQKRVFTYPVTYKASDLVLDVGDTRVTRNSDRRVTRNGDVRISHRNATMGTSHLLKAKKRVFSLPVIMIED